MNVLLVGGQGMAGHMIASYWHRVTDHRLTVTIRPVSVSDGQDISAVSNPMPQSPDICVRELDAREFLSVEQAVRESRPDLIINTVGVLNREAEYRPLESYLVNGLLPHWLAHLAEECGARLLHISTDCVFSGDRGLYSEEEQPDGHTVYARTKALGEVRHDRHLTIRTSIIGPDMKPQGIGLMQWFLSRQGDVKGYRNVLWNGVTTLELAKALLWFAERPAVGGLIHLAAPESVSKLELLSLLQEQFGKRDATLIPQDEPRIDRTLAVTRNDISYPVPDYRIMLRELQEWMSRP